MLVVISKIICLTLCIIFLFCFLRLYTKGIFVGYQRGLRNQSEQTSLIKLEGVNTKADTEFYMGKRIAYVYRVSKKSIAKGNRKASKIRVIWGKVTRPHGSIGTVRASFRHNLPPKAIGGSVRVVSNTIILFFHSST